MQKDDLIFVIAHVNFTKPLKWYSKNVKFDSTKFVLFQNLEGALNISVTFNVLLKMTENENCKALFGHSAIDTLMYVV